MAEDNTAIDWLEKTFRLITTCIDRIKCKCIVQQLENLYHGEGDRSHRRRCSGSGRGALEVPRIPFCIGCQIRVNRLDSRVRCVNGVRVKRELRMIDLRAIRLKKPQSTAAVDT